MSSQPNTLAWSAVRGIQDHRPLAALMPGGNLSCRATASSATKRNLSLVAWSWLPMSWRSMGTTRLGWQFPKTDKEMVLVRTPSPKEVEVRVARLVRPCWTRVFNVLAWLLMALVLSPHRLNMSKNSYASSKLTAWPHHKRAAITSFLAPTWRKKVFHACTWVWVNIKPNDGDTNKQTHTHTQRPSARFGSAVLSFAGLNLREVAARSEEQFCRRAGLNADGFGLDRNIHFSSTFRLLCSGVIFCHRLQNVICNFKQKFCGLIQPGFAPLRRRHVEDQQGHRRRLLCPQAHHGTVCQSTHGAGEHDARGKHSLACRCAHGLEEGPDGWRQVTFIKVLCDHLDCVSHQGVDLLHGNGFCFMLLRHRQNLGRESEHRFGMKWNRDVGTRNQRDDIWEFTRVTFQPLVADLPTITRRWKEWCQQVNLQAGRTPTPARIPMRGCPTAITMQRVRTMIGRSARMRWPKLKAMSLETEDFMARFPRFWRWKFEPMLCSQCGLCIDFIHWHPRTAACRRSNRRTAMQKVKAGRWLWNGVFGENMLNTVTCFSQSKTKLPSTQQRQGRLFCFL